MESFVFTHWQANDSFILLVANLYSMILLDRDTPIHPQIHMRMTHVEKLHIYVDNWLSRKLHPWKLTDGTQKESTSWNGKSSSKPQLFGFHVHFPGFIVWAFQGEALFTTTCLPTCSNDLFQRVVSLMLPEVISKDFWELHRRLGECYEAVSRAGKFFRFEDQQFERGAKWFRETGCQFTIP